MEPQSLPKRHFFKKRITHVYSTPFLDRVIQKVKEYRQCAIDFEYDPYYRYIDRICLIQIGTPQEIFLIDSLEPNLDVKRLREVMEDPNIEKIFHDAEQDLRLLKKALSIQVKNLFDTSVAARVLGLPQPSLKRLIKNFFAISIPKTQSRAEWGTRPLSEEMTRYAANDVRFLLEIGTILKQELTATQQFEEAKELFEWIEYKEPDVMEFNPDSFLSIPSAKDLPNTDLPILKELYLWRENYAMKTTQVSFRILSTNLMFELTNRKPTTNEALVKILGRNSTFSSGEQEEILARIQKGMDSDPIDPKAIATTKKWLNLTAQQRKEASLQTGKQKKRFQALLQWRREKAEERNLDQTVVIPKEILLDLSNKNPSNLQDLQEYPGFGSWRKQTYGEELISWIEKANKEYACKICGEEFNDNTLTVQCPFCHARFHIHEIQHATELEQICPVCKKKLMLV